MTYRDSPWPDGTPCWVDLMVPDRKKALAFYGPLLGWEFREGSEENNFYTMALIDGRPVAGVGQSQPGEADIPVVWTTYLATSDLDKTIVAITEAGGQIIVPAIDVMTEGRMAIAADPTGAVFGVWQSGDHTGTEVTGVPGVQAWNECMTRDFEGAKAFYSQVFGHGFDDMSGDGFTYAVLTVGGEVVGGLGALSADVPAEVPPNWGTCFAVSDADASAAKVTELGGTVLSRPTDTPHGRHTLVTDDQGATFTLIAPNS